MALAVLMLTACSVGSSAPAENDEVDALNAQLRSQSAEIRELESEVQRLQEIEILADALVKITEDCLNTVGSQVAYGDAVTSSLVDLMNATNTYWSSRDPESLETLINTSNEASDSWALAKEGRVFPTLCKREL
jgi:hypothetical protein